MVAFFCFDLPNFVLAARFYAVNTSEYSANEVRGFAMLPSIVAFATEKASLYTKATFSLINPSQCANQESNKVERYSKTDCSG